MLEEVDPASSPKSWVDEFYIGTTYPSTRRGVGENPSVARFNHRVDRSTIGELLSGMVIEAFSSILWPFMEGQLG